MRVNQYPMLEINLKKVRHNAMRMVDLCSERGLSIAGVVKGFNGLYPVAKQFESAGCKYLSSSRIEQLIELKLKGLKLPSMLIRIPMHCELKDMVQHVDISLNSERVTLDEINRICGELGTTHKVVLMCDLGDLREGFISEDELLEMAVYVEKQLENVILYGIGTNLGCYGSIKPTKDNISKLSELAERIETIINRPLDMVSGGATSSLPLLLEGGFDHKVNNLRIGEGILLGMDLKDYWHYTIDGIHNDTFLLKAQIVEIKSKPSYPIGEIFIDAFGNTPEYKDHGIRKRALLAVGKQDFGHHDDLHPTLPGVKIVGSSSDHLIVDVDTCETDLEIGDVLTFQMYYPPMLYLSGCQTVNKVYID